MKYNIKRFIIILLGGLFVNSVCAQEREKPTLKLGGCLRFNYRYNDSRWFLLVRCISFEC